jgi:AraC-like DNA-binding protein
MRKEWTRYFRDPSLHDLEVLHAGFLEHRFSRHAHEYFVIGYVESGVQAYRYRGAHHQTAAGQIFFVNPGESHTGEAAGAEGYVYRTLYPRTELLGQVVLDLTGHARVLSFKEAVISDPSSLRMLARFHRALAVQAPRLTVESLLLDSLMQLVTRHMVPHVSEPAHGKERRAVRLAQEYLRAHFGEAIPLGRLAKIAGISAFHLARAFRLATGLPPHAYLEMVRIGKARELLARGVPIADVSLATGYAEQSHFTHRFRRALGITPGVYARGSKILQDRESPVRSS